MNPNSEKRRDLTSFQLYKAMETDDILAAGTQEEMTQIVNDTDLFFKSLPSASYVVTKTLARPKGYKKKVKRTLRLNSKGIENVRKSGNPSSFYCYDSILKVSLRGPETVVLEYKGAEHPYIYKSPIAIVIAQEISSRILLTKKRKKGRFAYNKISEYQEKMNAVSSDLVEQIEVSNPETESSFTREFKLNNILGISEEQRIELTITRYLTDDSNMEAKAVKTFVNSIGTVTKTKETGLMNIRNFMNSLYDHIQENRKEDLSKFVTDENDVNRIVERAIEQIVVMDVLDAIQTILDDLFGETDTKINEKLFTLKNEDQEFFNIPSEHVSASNWDIPVMELNQVNNYQFPYQKISCILSCARMIYAMFKFEHKDSNETLGMDDFLPILIYVVARSSITNLESLSQFLFALCDDELMTGESGYYLTVFYSAVQYLCFYGEDITEG
eukprot:TRINITY_DN787_c0_g1_i1.p1 TRINITY_DN787_c0_g1~~TRINITY_DN787_c0_g1_i1.p1  ORF type:complete len:443 (-),score=89.51 TRINITY_DN787_c0_g1_i1:48-1376(-)